jgi:hypothetical protein
MRSFDLGRYALCSYAAAALLSGCGGSQPPIGAPGAMPQTATVRRTSESSGALIYAPGGCGGTCVLSYPKGHVIGKVKMAGAAPCSDKGGNVFIPSGGQVLEYQHGATSPFWTYNLPGSDAAACSIHPSEEYPAIVFRASGSAGDVVIFNNGIYYPTVYSSGINSYYCGYDDAGDLFVSGLKSGKPAISELANGQSTFTRLSISGELGLPGQIQWDGSYITYESTTPSRPTISELSISGSVATVVRTIRLSGEVDGTTQSWIYNGNVLVPFSSSRSEEPSRIGIWPYPQGGKQKRSIKLPRRKSLNISGVTISVAPSSAADLSFYQSVSGGRYECFSCMKYDLPKLEVIGWN